MAQPPILRGRMVSGKIQWRGIDKKRLATLTAYLEGHDVEMVLRKSTKKRSLNQNSFYWGVVVAMIAEAAGYSTPDEAHDALRMHFLAKQADGQLPTVRSTTDLSTVEFNEYIAKCQQLGAEMFGIYIPDPGEVVAA